MILVKSPLRVCLSGGGTDLPSFYKLEGIGKTISMAINKFVFVWINEIQLNHHLIRYSESEHPQSFSEIEHPLIKEILRTFADEKEKLEIISASDIPSGTGLGSSGAFCVSLLYALFCYQRRKIEISEVCDLACMIEIEKVRNGSGKQDQFISGFGGVKELTYFADGHVDVEDLDVDPTIIEKLSSRLLLVYTKRSRSASVNLHYQSQKTNDGDADMINRMKGVYEQNVKLKNILKSGSIDDYAIMLNDHWAEKRTRSPDMTLEEIDDIIRFGLKNGASGAKLIGAGGGGVILFYTKERVKLANSVYKKFGLKDLPFDIEYSGVRSL